MPVTDADTAKARIAPTTIKKTPNPIPMLGSSPFRLCAKTKP